MRYVDLDTFITVRKRVSFQMGRLFGLPIGIILFLLTISTGFFGALLFGLLAGGSVFGLIYFLREITHKGVERKRSKITFAGKYIDVLFKGEIGALVIMDDSLKYYNLTPGGANKDFDIPINDDLFIISGPIEYSFFQKLKMGKIEEGHITIKEMPNGLPRQFILYNINTVLESINYRVQEVNQFVSKE